MTIKTRNRFNIALFIISIIFFIFNITILTIQIFNGQFIFNSPEYTLGTSIFTEYNPLVPIISLFIQILYVSISSFMLFRIFEKTQASDIVYFHLFLFACLIDSFRLWIPLFNISDTYSNLLIFCGNTTIFSKILIPLSLFFTVVMGNVEQRQNIEKYVFLLILISFFMAEVIPLNTSITCPNFSVDFGFKKIIFITTIIIMIVCITSQYINNKKLMHSQMTTIGYSLIYIGIYILFNSISFLRLILAVLILSFGTIIYLKTLHNQYLWND